MTKTPRAVARVTPDGQPVQEELKNFSVRQLRELYAPYTPNGALLGEFELLQRQRAHYMIEWMRPILWLSTEQELLPVGYVHDTARLLSLLDATTLVTAIIQRSEVCPGPYPLRLQDELQWGKRNYAAIEDSVKRRRAFAEAHGEKYLSHRMLAAESGITASSFSRHLNHV